MPRGCALLLLWMAPLAGCAAGAAPPVQPLPPPAAADSVAAAPAEPEPSLEERWRAPFAVVSSGRPAPRPEREVVVRPAAPAAAAPAPVPAEPTAARAAEEAAPALPPATARAEPVRPAPQRGAAARTHRVERGETWYGIARRYGVASGVLAAANPDVDPDRLRAGTVLRIPPAGAQPAPAARTHTVGPGDSLWGIARRYGVSMERIRAANGLKDEQVRLGQTLIIPAPEEEG